MLLLIPILSFSQEKRDNTIIVRNVSFDSAVVRLLDLNYKIAKIDKDYKTVQTEIDKWDLVIYVRQKKNDLIITADIHSTGLVIPLEYGFGAKGRWKSLVEYASYFGPLEYSKN